MKKTIIISIIITVAVIGIYFFMRNPSPAPSSDNSNSTSQSTGATGSGTTQTSPAPSVAVTPVQVNNAPVAVIGKSFDGRDITAYHYGTGAKELLFVGGIHGGYEWNTVLVAYELKNYLDANPGAVPAGVRVTVIPVLNPDGLNKVVGTTTGNFTQADVSKSSTVQVSGRFNSNNVDLNRNFDCDWQSTGTWQSTPVSGGSGVFSEPESQAMKNYIDANKPAAVVVWYSAAGGIYASNCHAGVSTETDAIMKAFAKASGYSAHDSFDFYATTGDMTNWLAKNNIPAISVLLTNHTDTEWSKNLAGIKALLKYYNN